MKLKYCEKCSLRFNDATEYCTICGQRLTTLNTKNTKVAYSYRVSIILCIIGIFIGLYLVFCTLSDDFFFGMYLGGWGDCPNESLYFGADFYTEMYDVTQDVAYNTREAVSLLEDGFKTVSVVLGSSMALGFGLKMVDLIQKHKENEES